MQRQLHSSGLQGSLQDSTTEGTAQNLRKGAWLQPCEGQPT